MNPVALRGNYIDLVPLTLTHAQALADVANVSRTTQIMLPGQCLASEIKEIATVFAPQFMDHSPDSSSRINRFNRRRASAHIGFDPTRVHDNGGEPGIFDSETLVEHI